MYKYNSEFLGGNIFMPDVYAHEYIRTYMYMYDIKA